MEAKDTVLSDGQIRATCLGEGIYWAGEKCETAKGYMDKIGGEMRIAKIYEDEVLVVYEDGKIVAIIGGRVTRIQATEADYILIDIETPTSASAVWVDAIQKGD